MKIATVIALLACAALLVAVATRPVWLHVVWTWRERRSRNRRGGQIL